MIHGIKAFMVSFGFNPLRILRLLKSIPWYLAQKSQFHRSLSQSQEWPISTYPINLTVLEQSSSLGEYFWQDLFVAKQIITSNPLRHVDVGSRIDGFIVPYFVHVK